MSKTVVLCVAILSVLLPFANGKWYPYSEVSPKQEEAVFESFKHNLIRYYSVSESFAEEFKQNLKRAVNEEKTRLGIGIEKHPRQNPLDEEEDEDDEEASTTTTQGPSPFNIVNGIYGILSGVGTLNPDRVFASTVNFFPPSQKQTAQALIDSALGQKPGTWPTPTTTIPTTTKPTTKDPDDEEDEDEDATTPKAQVAAVAVAAVTPAPAPTAVATVATVVAAVPAVAVTTAPVSATVPVVANKV